jgi:hypothetical protein
MYMHTTRLAEIGDFHKERSNLYLLHLVHYKSV